jgi:hypothetical protein
MNPRHTPIVLLAFVAVAIAACNGSDNADTTIESVPAVSSTSTTSTPSTTVGPTSTEVVVTTTTAPVATAPPAEVALDDFEFIIEELSRRRVAMYAAPNLDLIAGICVPGSECDALYQAQIGEQIDLGERTVGEPSADVTEFEIIGFNGPTLEESRGVVVRYVSAPLGTDLGAIVDRDGNVVIELSVENPDKAGRGEVTLFRSDDDPSLPWRIFNQKSLGPVS